MQPLPATLQSSRFWRILVATWVCYSCYSMLRRPLSVVRATMIQDKDMSMHESGMIDTSFLIMYTAGQLWYPSIRARIPFASRHILAAGLGLSGVIMALFSVASFSSPVFTFVARSLLWGLLGLAQAVGWASCLVVLTPWLEARERGGIMGMWSTNMALGGAVGNTLSSLVLSASGGSSWSSVFVACGVVAVIVSAILFLTLGSHPNSAGLRTAAQQQRAHELPETAFESMLTGSTDIEGEWIVAGDGSGGDQKGIGSSGSNSGGGPISPLGPKAPLQEGHVAFLPGISGIAFSYFFHKLVRYVLMFWLPYYLTTALKMDPASAGMTATALDFGGIVGTVGSGFLSDKIGQGRRKALTSTVLAGAMILCLLGFASGLAHAGTLPTLVLCFCCGACTFGIDSLLTGSLLQDHCEKIGVPHRIGAVGAFVGGVGTLGSMLQGPFTVLMSSVSWAWLWISMVGMTGVALMTIYPVVRTEARSAIVRSEE